MKSQFTDVGPFLAEATRRETEKNDFIVPQSKLRMTDDGLAVTFDGGFSQYELTPNAHGQLASKLDIPKAYYDRMSRVDGLRTTNVNRWLEREPTVKRFVRTSSSRCRAVLSDAYRPIDNILILRAAMPLIARNADLVVRSASMTDDAMFLQASFPKIAGEIRVGDVVELGFTISTSETGNASLDVRKWIHQLRCSNGYIGESVLNQRHVGRRLGGSDEDYSVFKADTIDAEVTAFGLRLRDILDEMLSPVAFEADLRRFRNARGDTFLPAETADVVKSVTRRYEFREAEVEAIVNRMFADSDARGGDFSRLAVADAVTYVAGEAPAERAFDLEKAGGALVALTSAEWRTVVAA